MKRRLDELLAGVDHRLDGNATVAVTAVTGDSRRVVDGAVFVAVRGTAADGHAFVDAALDAGATAVVVEDAEVARRARARGAVAVVVPSTREAIGRLTRRWYDAPDRTLDVVAVTGTNGKTTVSHLVRDLMRALGRRCGLIGTIRYDDLHEEIAAPLTTPGPEDLMALLARVRSAGGDAVAMEASSHALDQRRLSGIEVDVGAFTNITRDHLDYHGTHENYVAAKRRLLDHLFGRARTKAPGRAVAYVDDPTLGSLQWPASTVRVGRHEDCEVRLLELHTDGEGTVLEVAIGDGRARLESRLLGGYNGANLLVTVGIGHALGLGLEAMREAFPSLRPVPGRLEPVPLPGGPVALVDYAHTPDGMRGALEAVVDLTPGRVHLVFGCGGDRDRGKRPEMAAVAGSVADRIVLTIDNPRTEDPERIFSDTLAGFGAASDRVHRIDDRREAIADALGAAGPDDVVLVCGKGHETYQIIGTEKLPWDDREVLREAWRSIGGVS